MLKILADFLSRSLHDSKSTTRNIKPTYIKVKIPKNYYAKIQTSLFDMPIQKKLRLSFLRQDFMLKSLYYHCNKKLHTSLKYELKYF